MKLIINAEKIKKLVLDQVSMQVGASEFVSIMGPSGSGKSTLLFCLAGMDSIESGSLTFEEIDLVQAGEGELAKLRRTRMGFVFQQATMLRNLSLYDNIILAAMTQKTSRIDKKEYEAKIRSRAELFMKKMDIWELRDRAITKVSGGQLQRASICRAMMNEPSILFADEPTGALNSKMTEDIMEILTQLNREGTAVLLVTHDKRVAAHSKRVIFLKDGKIADDVSFSDEEQGMKEEIISKKMSGMGI
ncbi:MAG: putative transport system ATP-binding protein [Clostridiales bacterium]|nr:putative transport system ATP-binding protein [Clostridiales bacterium]